MNTKFYFLLSILMLTVTACSKNAVEANAQPTAHYNKISKNELTQLKRAYFASGCFWCVEAIFESVEGVAEVHSGYSGGHAKTANYSAVSSGSTRHAESVEVFYDPKIVSYKILLQVFFGSHDPTTFNQQGPDRGPQYRSAIFYQNDNEKSEIASYIEELTANKVFSGKITTEVTPLDHFYMAEDYHQDYERLHPHQSYVRAVSIPRLRRFQAKFPSVLKGKSH